MHIILEGVAPYEIKCVLNHFVLSEHMELDAFNSAIIVILYSLLDVRDKPCPISVNTLSSNDNKLKQSAGQMLVLLKSMHECSQNVHETHPIFSSQVDIGPVSEVQNVHYVEGKIKDFLEIQNLQHIVSVKWIMQHGNKCRCEKTLVICNVINSTPESGLVKNIYIVNSSLYCFECQPLSINEWNDHYLSYEVQVPYLAQANIFVDADKLD